MDLETQGPAEKAQKRPLNAVEDRLTASILDIITETWDRSAGSLGYAKRGRGRPSLGDQKAERAHELKQSVIEDPEAALNELERLVCERNELAKEVKHYRAAEGRRDARTNRVSEAEVVEGDDFDLKDTRATTQKLLVSWLHRRRGERTWRNWPNPRGGLCIWRV